MVVEMENDGLGLRTFVVGEVLGTEQESRYVSYCRILDGSLDERELVILTGGGELEDEGLVISIVEGRLA